MKKVFSAAGITFALAFALFSGPGLNFSQLPSAEAGSVLFVCTADGEYPSCVQVTVDGVKGWFCTCVSAGP